MKDNIKPEIAVLGAGAIGSLVGGILANKGEAVTLIGRGEHIDTISRRGLTVDGIRGTINVRLATAKKLEFEPDIIFLAVKTQDVEESCREIKRKAPHSPVVLMQNGVTSADIAGRILDNNPVLSCVLMLNSRYLKPGTVSYIAEKPIVIGSSYRADEAFEKQVQMLLNNVAQTTISSNIAGVQWTKLVINSMGNALDALSGLNMGTYRRYNEMITLALLILREAFSLTDQAKIKMESIPGVPVTLFKRVIRLPFPIPFLFMRSILSSNKDEDVMTSTLQSLKRGRKTEIDYLNGEFVKLGESIGIETPVNSRVVELIHKIEDTGKFYLPEELKLLFEL